jgi:hypothetical protein
MAKLLLDIATIEDDFFEDCRLFSIGCGLAAHSICWHMNTMLDVQFQREPDMDIQILDQTKPSKSTGLLFQDTEIQQQEVFFPVFKHRYPYLNAEAILYTNKSMGKVLLPEAKNADYLLVQQLSSYINQDLNFVTQLNKIPAISWIKELEVSLLKSKTILII